MLAVLRTGSALEVAAPGGKGGQELFRGRDGVDPHGAQAGGGAEAGGRFHDDRAGFQAQLEAAEAAQLGFGAKLPDGCQV